MNSSYVFDNLSRIGMDNCYMQQKDIENTNYSTYMLQNYFLKDCKMTKPIELATSQPGIIYGNGGYGNCIGGNNIDDSSKLLIGSIQTNPKCRISLLERPFVTVPYLGRGSVDPIVESKIQQGEFISSKKTVMNLGQIQQTTSYPNILSNSSVNRRDNYINALNNSMTPINSKDMYRDTLQNKR